MRRTVSASDDEIGRLLKQLAEAAEAERLQAIEILESFHQDSAPAVAGLAKALSDPAMNVRMRAANALAAYGTSSLPTLDALVAALRDLEPPRRPLARSARQQAPLFPRFGSC